MKPSDLIEAIERFFNDIIGTLIPGIILLLSIWYLIAKPIYIAGAQLFPPRDSMDWFLFILFGYIAGHFVISFGNLIIIKIIDLFIGLFKKTRYLKWLIPSHCIKYAELLINISASEEYRAFKEIINKRKARYANFEPDKVNVKTMRSIAMTIANEDTHVVHRFMFISLFNIGMATVLILFTVTQFVILLLNELCIKFGSFNISFWSIAIPMIFSVFLVDRRYEFYSRSLRVPFLIALARIISQDFKKESGFTSERYSPLTDRSYISEGKLVVYLAGGFYSNWQDTIIKKFPSVKFLDPRSHGLKDEKGYTFWDLEAIKKSDCIFAYFEEDNPGGFALASEIGYAKALNKIVIFIDEKSKSDEKLSGYLKMLHELADANYFDFEKGMLFFEKYIAMRK